MKQEINIPYYTNYYGLSDLPCVDLLLAAAAGHYSDNNYFHYAFYEAIRGNWTLNKKRSWLEDKQEKLGLFGLGIKAVEMPCSEDFHDQMQAHLDMREIILLPLKLNQLFYTWAFGESVPLDHFILVSGYDTDKGIYTIRDSDINSEVLRPIIKGNPIYKLNIPSEMLHDMWIKSNVSFQGIPRYENKFYVIYEKEQGSHEIEPDRLLKELLLSASEKSGLVTYIKQFNNKLDTRIDFEKCRRTYHGAARVVVEYIARFCINEESDLRNDFLSFSKIYIKNRYKQLSILHAHYLRRKELKQDQIESMCHVDEKADRQLFNFIWSGLYNHKTVKQHLINDSDMAVYADSTCIPPDHPQDQYKYSPQNVLFGAYEGWRSDKATAEHWLRVVLPSAKKICKIVIIHDATALTQDYKVSIRSVDNTWYEVATRVSNQNTIDVVNIDVICATEIRVDITVPDANDYYARIKKLEMWE